MGDDKLRSRIMELLGRFPERAALELRSEAAFEEPDHTRTLVSYFVEPGERIAAWLLPGPWCAA